MDKQNDNSARGVGKIATVSEVFWYKTKHGKCPQCGRERDLGQVNDKFQDQFTDRSLYALSATSLRSFLDQNGQSYTKMSSACTSENKN